MIFNKKIKLLSKLTLIFSLINFIASFSLFLFFIFWIDEISSNSSNLQNEAVDIIIFSWLFIILMIIFGIALITIGIFQVIESSKYNYKLGIWAGIINIVSSILGPCFLFVPILGIIVSIGLFVSQIVLNIMVLANLK